MMEDGRASADIIAFPGMLAKAEGNAEGDNDAAILDRAVLALNRALAEQQQAVQAWLAANEALAESLQSLAEHCRAFEASVRLLGA